MMVFFFYYIVHHCGIFKFACLKERIYQVKDLILGFSLKENWELFLRFVLISKTFVILISMYYYPYFLSLTAKAPSPAPASSPCCGSLHVHLELAGLAWPRRCRAAAEGRQCKGCSFSPAVAITSPG